MRWQVCAVVCLVLLGFALDWWAARPPAWVTQDPLVHPFGLGSPLPKLAPAAVDTVPDPPEVTAEAPLAINRATLFELAGLPRVGPVLASRIVAYRDSVGAFQAVAELQQIRGIGPSTVALLTDLVTFQ